MIYVEGKSGIQDFYIGKYEITQEQWISIMGNNPSPVRGESLPVVDIKLRDIQQFITNLNQKTGRKYRLPTEAEWEYAARGGNLSRNFTYSGSNYSNDVAWFSSNSNRSGPFTVGTKAPNELGIYDMSGNVWECCVNSNNSRAFRGGACDQSEQNCMMNSRITSSRRNFSDKFYGFRLVLSF